MNKTKHYWLLITLLILNACETSDPASLPYRPVLGSSSSGNTVYIQPPAQALPQTVPSTPVPPAEQNLHPLQIHAMRAQQYPGSDIVIERVLEAGVNYSRYYVSYLSEGLRIYALMTVPTGEKPASGWPVVIFNHGYIPPAEYRTTERYIAYVDQIARSGYIVFRSDYRGHDRSEGRPGGIYTSPNYSIDVLNAVASVKRYPEADPNRIGMWGHSMGGYITLRSMVVSNDIKAGVIWAGVVARYPDLFTRWNPGVRVTAASPGSWVYSLEQAHGSVEQNPAFWNSISANAYLKDLDGPIQLHHGTGDTVVPWEFSEMLYNEMLAADQVVEFYTYEGDNHNISNYFDQAMQRTIEFFDRYLKTG